MTLKWQLGADGAWYGFSGGINHAKVEQCAGPAHWKWQIFGASVEKLKTHGYNRSRDAATRAAGRAWSTAVNRGGLAA